MKKAVLILTGYYLFSFAVIQAMLPRGLSFIDYASMLFLNTNAFPALQLSKLSFQFIITFLLLFILVLYFLIQSMTESVSFMGMVIYRQGKLKTMKSRGIFYLRRVGFLALVVFLETVVFYLLFSQFHFYPGLAVEIAAVALYLVRYFLVVFCVVFLYEIGNMTGKCGVHCLILYAAFLAMMAADAVFGLHFITLSGRASTEATALLVTVLAGFAACLSGSRYFSKKGDIL